MTNPLNSSSLQLLIHTFLHKLSTSPICTRLVCPSCLSNNITALDLFLPVFSYHPISYTVLPCHVTSLTNLNNCPFIGFTDWTSNDWTWNDRTSYDWTANDPTSNDWTSNDTTSKNVERRNFERLNFEKDRTFHDRTSNRTELRKLHSL
jgi:hypothetical protein